MVQKVFESVNVEVIACLGFIQWVFGIVNPDLSLVWALLLPKSSFWLNELGIETIAADMI